MFIISQRVFWVALRTFSMLTVPRNSLWRLSRAHHMESQSALKLDRGTRYAGGAAEL